MRSVFLVLVAMCCVVAVSGCASSGSSETEVVSKDMLEIVSVQAIPSDVVRPGERVNIVMRVKNVGQTDVWLLLDRDMKQQLGSSTANVIAESITGHATQQEQDLAEAGINPGYVNNPTGVISDSIGVNNSQIAQTIDDNKDDEESQTTSSDGSAETSNTAETSDTGESDATNTDGTNEGSTNTADNNYVEVTAAKPTFDGDMMLVNHCAGLYDVMGAVKVLSDSKACDSDYPTFSLMGETPASACYVKFRPGQTHVFQWDIEAPSRDKLGGISNECMMNFQTIYAGYAKTITYVYFATPKEVAQRIYTEQDLEGVGDNIASYGPVYVNFETGEPQPIRAGSDDTWTVYLNVNNVGAGIAHIKDITLDFEAASGVQAAKSDFQCGLKWSSNKGTLSEVWIDEKLDSVLDLTDPDKDECEDLDVGSADRNFCEKYFDMKNLLEIYDTKTSTFSCQMTVPDDIFVLKPYLFTATSFYSYSQGMNFVITTDPN